MGHAKTHTSSWARIRRSHHPPHQPEEEYTPTVSSPVANSAFSSACSFSGLCKIHKTFQWEIAGVQKYTNKTTNGIFKYSQQVYFQNQIPSENCTVVTCITWLFKKLWTLKYKLFIKLWFFPFLPALRLVLTGSWKEWHFQSLSFTHNLPCAFNDMPFVRSKPPFLHPYSLLKLCTVLGSIPQHGKHLIPGLAVCGIIITWIPLMCGMVCVSIVRAKARLCIQVVY